MLNTIKSFWIGFTISFLGSIPLGYLNIVGAEIYQKNTISVVVQYLIGVVMIETIVILGTLKLVTSFTLSPKWKNRISIYSCLFLLFLAYYFFTKDPENATTFKGVTWISFRKYPFFLGLFLSAINLAQIPFWLSWNLLVVQETYIQNSKKTIPLYIIGTAIGTFLGMLSFILFLDHILNNNAISEYKIQRFYWVIFLLLAFVQIGNVLVRHKKKSLNS